MEEALSAFSKREISFDEFARRTAADWNRLATSVYRRWHRRMPLGVTVEDLRQELLLHAWLAVGDFDATRGVALKSFVVFMAMSKTTRFINQQRNSWRRNSDAESRYPIAFGVLAEGDDAREEWLETLGATEPPELERLIDERQRFEAAKREAEGIDLWSLVAVAEASGDVVEAAQQLFDITAVKRACRWGSPGDAQRQVFRSLSACLAV